jgi:hypothetical protein
LRPISRHRFFQNLANCNRFAELESVFCNDGVRSNLEFDAARMIRSIKESGWRVSGKLAQEYPQLADPALALHVVEAVQSAFEDRAPLPIIG